MSTDLSAYISGTVDVLAWRGVKASGDVLLTDSLADDNSDGEICTGVQLVSQRFLLHLLNETGSVRNNAAVGTDFMSALRQGSIRTEADLRAAFTLAELTARANLQREESAIDPDAERYLSATLTSVSLVSGYAMLYVRLETRATSVDVVLPVSIVV